MIHSVGADPCFSALFAMPPCEVNWDANVWNRVFLADEQGLVVRPELSVAKRQVEGRKQGLNEEVDSYRRT